MDGVPADGPTDFVFRLFDAASGGNQIGTDAARSGVSVVNGLFTVDLDFGNAAFNGEARFLAVTVEGTPLPARQPIGPAPYALKVPGIDGHSLDASDGSPTDVVFVNAAGNVGIGTTTPNAKLSVAGGLDVFDGATQGITLTTHLLRFNRVSNEDPVYAYDDAVGTHTFYGGGSPSVSILDNGRVGIGVSDPSEALHVAGNLRMGGVIKSEAAPLRFALGTVEALRLEPTAGTPNLVAGHHENLIDDSVVGAVIAGGGNSGLAGIHEIRPGANYAAIGGGIGNGVGNLGGGEAATVCGGSNNLAGADYSTVLGGQRNSATGAYSVASGWGASARNYGQVAHAAGEFDIGSEAQTSTLVLRGVSSGTAQSELFLDGASVPIRIPDGRTWAFDILIVARTFGDTPALAESAGYRITGVVEGENGAASAFVGTPQVTTLAEDDPTWSVTVATGVAATPTINGLLRIMVTGGANDTVAWVASVRTAELRF